MASNRVNTPIRMSPELLARLDAAASERGVNRNWFICKLLDESLERLVPLELLRRPRDEEAK